MKWGQSTAADCSSHKGCNILTFYITYFIVHFWIQFSTNACYVFLNVLGLVASVNLMVKLPCTSLGENQVEWTSTMIHARKAIQSFSFKKNLIFLLYFIVHFLKCTSGAGDWGFDSLGKQLQPQPLCWSQTCVKRRWLGQEGNHVTVATREGRSQKTLQKTVKTICLHLLHFKFAKICHYQNKKA